MTFAPFAPVQTKITDLTSRVTSPISGMSFFDQSHLFVELSALAYFDPKSAKSWATKIGFPNLTVFGDSEQMALVFSNETDIVVSFRGTYSVIDVATDLDADLSKDGKLIGKVHDGFRKRLDILWPKIQPLLDNEKKLWLTGHSMGGAVAAILAVRFAREKGRKVESVFSFGQPRIGDILYVAGVSTPLHRWVNHVDIVTKLPTPLMGYQHFGKEHYINRNGLYRPNIVNSVGRFIAQFFEQLSLEGISDHDIAKYRDAIIRYSNESDNGKR